MGISKINEQTLPTSTTAITTATPTISINSSTPVFGSLTVTVNNHDDYTNPNYSVTSKLSDGTAIVGDDEVDRFLESDKSHIGATLNVSDANASTAERTLTVKVQEFEDSIQSGAATLTYTPSYVQNKYIRLTGVTSNGSASNSYMGITNIGFYEESGQGGTEYPTTNLTGDSSETGIVVSAGHTFSSGTYDPWKACDSNTAASMWWSLSTSAANNWWQIEFTDGTYTTKPIIKSIKIMANGYLSAHSIKITGSNNSDHSSPTDYGIFTMKTTGTINIG
jgi:hypothetical protein